MRSFTNGDGGRIYTATTEDAAGSLEVIGLTHDEYTDLYRRLYRQQGVVIANASDVPIEYKWLIGYTSDLARECAAGIFPAVFNGNRAIEYDDVMSNGRVS
jgi:hypothetical protein